MLVGFLGVRAGRIRISGLSRRQRGFQFGQLLEQMATYTGKKYRRGPGPERRTCI